MLDHKNTALVLIDVQGKLAQSMPEKEQLFTNLQRCVKAAQLLELPIFWIEQYPEGLGPTIPELANLLQALTVYSKTSFGCMGEERIAKAIAESGCHQLLLCGIEAHVCVYQSVRQMLEKGYQVTLIHDAIASREVANKEIAVQQCQALGASLTTTEMWMFEVLRDAQSDKFKSMLSIIK